MTTASKRTLAGGVLLLTALCATYSNHFHNSFHFDDWHTVPPNPWIRDLSNLPRFFTDSRTMSIVPTNQSYRPLVTASLALDYRLGHGLNLVYFQASTFFWYVVQLVLMFFLFHRIMQSIEPRERNAYLALFAVGWYALHPACAETVNYIIQRADLYVALGMVGGLLLYVRFPSKRKWGLYLVPVALAGLSKPTAVMFPALLIAYLCLIEQDRFFTAIRKAVPALLAAAGIALLQRVMITSTFISWGPPAYFYLITQPRVLLHYFFTFFLPIGLSADTDRASFPSFWREDAILGFVFLAALLGLAFYLGRRRQYRLVAFGIWWFLLSSLPTSLFSLGEVENDHRMFAPFVGLVLGATWAAAALWDRFGDRLRLGRFRPYAPAAAAVCLLAACAVGAYQRNRVWSTEDTLWQDVTYKSPLNPRGYLNYGVALIGRGQFSQAEAAFEKGLTLTPNDYLLEMNLGGALSALGRDGEAEGHLRRALALSPRNADPIRGFARWLKHLGRSAESIPYLEEAVRLEPMNRDSRLLLLEAYVDAKNWGELKAFAQKSLALYPGDGAFAAFLSRAEKPSIPAAAAEAQVMQSKIPDQVLELSDAYYRAGRFEDCVAAAKQALRLRSDFPEAYNNLAAGYLGLQRWDQAIRAAKEALRLRPGFQPARQNLEYALAQKNPERLATAQHPASPVALAELKVKQYPSSDNFLQLSLVYHQAGRFRDCIAAAQEALRLRPEFAEAYNNMAAGYQSLGMWDEAIKAASEALRIRPDFALARNNLAYAQAQKRAARTIPQK
ncbi:MAG: tetratricopeptide repeat protein [Bryobacteraceae bacterium]